MEKITKNPALNNFLFKYNKKDWNQVVLKLSLIALSYLHSLQYQKNFYSLNDLDQILFKLESLNISQMNKTKQIEKNNINKNELSQIYKPPIDNQLKRKKINKKNDSLNSKDLQKEEEKNLLKFEENKISNMNKNEINNKIDNKNENENNKEEIIDNNFINEPFLNSNKYDENLTLIPRIKFPSYKDCSHCHPCLNPNCPKCNYLIGNFNKNNEKNQNKSIDNKKICDDCK